MKTVIFVTNRDGKERPMKLKLAKHLAKAGKGYIKTGGYLTRDMTATGPTGSNRPDPQPGITPAARELAAENNIEIGAITGTGAGGAITVADVRKAVAEAE